jgi:hypothetical protein
MKYTVYKESKSQADGIHPSTWWLKQEDHAFKRSWGYIVTLVTIKKKKNEKTKQKQGENILIIYISLIKNLYPEYIII